MFEDRASAKSMERDAFQKMVSALEQHRFQVLLFWSRMYEHYEAARPLRLNR